MKKLALIILAPFFVVTILGFSGNCHPTDDANLYVNTLLPFHTEIDYWGPPPGVSEDGKVYIDAYGTGNATHMGLTDMVIHEVVYMESAYEWRAEADVVLTAANGDELHFNYTSTIDASALEELIIVGNCNITGGTGRFANASGSMTYNGTHNVFSSTGTVIFDGTIMY